MPSSHTLARVGSDVFVKFRYEERDVAGALRATMFASLRKRPDLWLAAIVLGGGLVVAARVTTGASQILVIACGVAFVSLIVSVLVVAPKLMFRRRAALRAPMAIDASDEGLTIIAGTRARTVAWSDLVRVEKGANVIVIHHGEEALIVPRRAFRNRAREEAFIALLGRADQARRDMRALDSGKSTPSANP